MFVLGSLEKVAILRKCSPFIVIIYATLDWAGPRLGPRSQQLARRPFESSALYQLIQRYMEQLPGAIKEVQLADGSTEPLKSYRTNELGVEGDCNGYDGCLV